MSVWDPLGARGVLGLALAAGLACGACGGTVASGPAPRSSVAAAAADESSPPPSPPPPPAAESMSTRRGVGWVVVAAGAEATAVAIATSFMMLHQKSLRDDGCDAQKRCTQAGIDANNTLHALAGWNAGAWITGAVGLGLGTLLVVTGSSDGEQKTAIGVSPNRSGMGLEFRSSF